MEAVNRRGDGESVWELTADFADFADGDMDGMVSRLSVRQGGDWDFEQEGNEVSEGGRDGGSVVGGR